MDSQTTVEKGLENMASVNIVIIAGNLTRDPELRYLPNGQAVADLGVAVNEAWTDDAGERKERVTFVEVTAWGTTAENAAKFLAKGRGVLIEGRLRLESWNDKQTHEHRSKLSVTADRVTFLDKPQGGNQ